MTESTLSPERVLILMLLRGAARAVVWRGAWKALTVLPARAPTMRAATRRIVPRVSYRVAGVELCSLLSKRVCHGGAERAAAALQLAPPSQLLKPSQDLLHPSLGSRQLTEHSVPKRLTRAEGE